MQRIENLLAAYGDGTDGHSPTIEQWKRLLDRPAGNNITLVNFFKLNDVAQYPADAPESRESLTGNDAFGRYAQTSVPTVEKVGGQFLLLGPATGVLFGEEEDWDLIAVGSYPGLENLMALFEDQAYQKVARHRSAACARLKVFICPA